MQDKARVDAEAAPSDGIIAWGPPLPDKVARPAIVGPLLERALAEHPDKAILHEKLAYLHLDRYDFAAAAARLETALGLDPSADDARLCLARCYNMVNRPRDALALLAPDDRLHCERAFALIETGDLAAAEKELRAILAEEPRHQNACRELCRLLRRSGRDGETAALCEDLAARGVGHAQLLYDWGWALALVGDAARARRLLFEPDRVERIELPVPAGFADIAAFNDALAEEILSNPNRVTNLPEGEANRGSSRVETLFAGSLPELIGALVQSLQAAAAAYTHSARDGFDPWPRARPAVARLRPWGLLQREGDYEAQHLHPGGWLSGVYYVRVPRSVSEGSDGRGCLEFGPPDGLAEILPGAAPTQRYVPREGLFLLAPSHYPHRTVPSGVAEDRISVAFDVVPDRPGA